MESLHWKFFKAVMQPDFLCGLKSQIAMKKYKVNLIRTIKQLLYFTPSRRNLHKRQ